MTLFSVSCNVPNIVDLVTSQGKLCVPHMVLCMEKVLLFTMMRRARKGFYLGYQSMFLTLVLYFAHLNASHFVIQVCTAYWWCFRCKYISPFTAGRYHSLVIDKETFPDDELEITAWTEDGLIMAVRHKKYKHLQVKFVSLRSSTTKAAIRRGFKLLFKSKKYCLAPNKK